MEKFNTVAYQNKVTYEHAKKLAATCKSRSEFTAKFPDIARHCRKMRWTDDFLPRRAKAVDYSNPSPATLSVAQLIGKPNIYNVDAVGSAPDHIRRLNIVSGSMWLPVFSVMVNPHAARTQARACVTLGRKAYARELGFSIANCVYLNADELNQLKTVMGGFSV